MRGHLCTRTCKSRRLAGVSEAGARSRDPERARKAGESKDLAENLMPSRWSSQREGICALGPVSRILSPAERGDGHSSSPGLAARIQRPTRRFGGPSRSARRLPAAPCLFGLAPCGVCRAPSVTSRPVRSYRTFSPLPRSFGAVCFLWHYPSSGFEAAVPGVTWHTALWSSDFPRTQAPATVRSGCNPLIICEDGPPWRRLLRVRGDSEGSLAPLLQSESAP